MHHAGQFRRRPLLAQNSKCVFPSIACMNHNRHTRISSYFQLMAKERLLDLLGNSPMVVETDFTDRYNFRMREQVLEMAESTFLPFGSVVRMNAYSCKDKWIGLRDT